MIPDSLRREFFDNMYLRNADPWKFASSEYERERYHTILRAISGRRYKHAFEPGCSVGVLTKQLACLCDAVDAIDISSVAVREAFQRCLGCHNVKIARGTLPQDIPRGPFDLVVFSEIGYYLHVRQLQSVIARLLDRMEDGAIFLGAHWLGSSADHVLTGDQVHHLIHSSAGLTHEYSEAGPGFRLDRWVRG